MKSPIKSKTQKGIIITLVLVFGAIFLLLLGGLLTFLTLQHRHVLHRAAWEKSLHIAEAGIHYSKWRLAHAPADFLFDGIYDFKDTAGVIIGQYQLKITAPTICDPGIKIKSTGWTIEFPNIRRTIEVIYNRPSLARYAFLTNSNVWFGPGVEVRGMVRSNVGIRMDGIQNSLFFSARETYTCGIEHNCIPPAEKPGIWGVGAGGAKGLWEFPVAWKDFEAITKDLAFLRSEAKLKGIYLGPPGLGYYGYYLRFRGDGTVDISRVKSLKPKVWGYNGEEWVFESNDFNKIAFFANFPLPIDCAPIFIEANVWVSGTVNGRVILAAAEFPVGVGKRIIIPNNIIRANPGSILALVAQENILIPLRSPDIITIEAVLLAQKGRVIRYFYPEWYAPYHVRREIKIFGSIISNDIWTFTWVDENGKVISGYKKNKINFDHSLTHTPPPYFPGYGIYEVVKWREL